MAFKLKTVTIDIDLDLTGVVLEGEEPIVKPVKDPKAKTFLEWAEGTKTTAEESAKIEQDSSYALKKIIKHVDFWYGKGYDWWVERMTFPQIQEILQELNSRVSEVKKK